MSIENSLLGKEIMDIVGKQDNNGTNTVTFDVIIHTPSYDIPIDKSISFDVMEDYNSNLTEHITVDFLCPMGDLVKTIYPHRNNVEISIILHVGDQVSHDRYKLIPINLNTDLGSGKYKKMSLDKLNEQEAVKVKAQCLDRSMEAIRLKKTHGIFRGINVKDFMRGILVYETRDIKIGGSSPDLIVTIEDPHNTRTYEHIIIPDGTKLIDVPNYLQSVNYGVYNGELGLYFKRMRMGTYFNRCDIKPTGIPCDKVLGAFIYPLYNTDIVDTAKHKMIIYGTYNQKYSQVENTYLLEPDIIKIVANNDSKKVNKGDSEFMDAGVGFVIKKANSIMRRPTDINVGHDIIDSGKSFTNDDSYMKNRSDGSMYRQTKVVDDNLFKIRSDYLKHNGDMLQLQWNFSNAKYLLPGMAIMYNYLGDDNNVISLKGVLQSHYTVYNNSSKMASTILNIFIEKDKSEKA